MPLTVSLGKCGGILNGSTEYDGFEEYVRVLTLRMLAKARIEIR